MHFMENSQLASQVACWALRGSGFTSLLCSVWDLGVSLRVRVFKKPLVPSWLKLLHLHKGEWSPTSCYFLRLPRNPVLEWLMRAASGNQRTPKGKWRACSSQVNFPCSFQTSFHAPSPLPQVPGWFILLLSPKCLWVFNFLRGLQ